MIAFFMKLYYVISVDSCWNYTDIFNFTTVAFGLICVLTFQQGSTAQSGGILYYGFSKGIYHNKILESEQGANPVSLPQLQPCGAMSATDNSSPKLHTQISEFGPWEWRIRSFYQEFTFIFLLLGLIQYLGAAKSIRRQFNQETPKMLDNRVAVSKGEI